MHLNRRSLEDLYLAAFDKALGDMQSILTPFSKEGKATFAKGKFSQLLHQNLSLNVDSQFVLKAASDEQVSQIATAIEQADLLVIPGNSLPRDGYKQLVKNFVTYAETEFLQSVSKDPDAFFQVFRSAHSENQALLREITVFLKHHNLELSEINRKMDVLLKQNEQGTAGNFFQDQLGLRLSSNAATRLEELREASREGKQVRSYIADLKSDQINWGVLEPDIRAEYLRLEAGTYIGSDNEKANSLAAEAKDLSPNPTKDTQLRVHIAYVSKHDYSSALSALSDLDDLRSAHLRAAFHLNLNQIDEAEEELDLVNTGHTANAETYRLRATAAAVRKDFTRGQREIDHASALKPLWIDVRFTAAVIGYLGSLSPAKADFAQLPLPISPAFYKQDAKSRERVRQAGETFAALADEMRDQPSARMTYETWYLACLEHDPARRKEAIKYCDALVRENPRHHQAIKWALSCSYNILLDTSTQTLATLVEEGKATAEDIVALAGCYLTTNKIPEATQLIENSQDVFEEAESLEGWQFWRVQMLAETGQTGPALVELNQTHLTPALRYARYNILRKLVKRRDDLLPVSVFLHDSFDATEDPLFLLESYRLRVEVEDRNYVAEHALTLLDIAGTAVALELVVGGAYKLGHYQLCLELLGGRESYFPNGKLSDNLNQIKVVCLQRTGRITDAVAEAERLAGKERSVERLFQLINLYTVSFDTDKAVTVIRELESKEGLAASELLELANHVKHHDRALSARLWRRALASNLDDVLVGQALGLTYQLGLEKEAEARDLLSRAADLAKRGSVGLSAVPVADIAAQFEARRGVQARVRDGYARGTIPAHVASGALYVPLLDLYHTAPQLNARKPNPARQDAVFIRHGMRVDIAALHSSSHLHLDTSSLLLAYHLDILDAVEDVYGSLYLPQEVAYALLDMRSKMQHPQPSKLDTIQTIKELVRQGDIKIVAELEDEGIDETLQDQLGAGWAALYERAKREGGYLVDFLPLENLSGPISIMPEDGERHLTNCRALMDALPLGKVERDRLLDALGSEGKNAALYAVPELHSFLFLEGTISEVLADAGALRSVCDQFVVHIEQRTLDRLEADHHAVLTRQAQLEWLDRLLSRLQHGVQSGQYVFLPTPPPVPERRQTRNSNGADLNVLASLLDNSPPEDSVYWFDDRYLNARMAHKGRPIVGVNEVLKGLLQEGRLSLDEYYRKLNELRRGNFRFLPLEADEVLYHLRQTAVGADGRLAETPQLVTLRRYTAAWLLRANMLQRPPRLRGQVADNGELIFSIRLSRIVDEALIAIWKNENDESICRAYSSWILESLSVDILGLRGALSLQNARQNDLALFTLNVATLISNGFEMLPQIRKRYFAWLNERLLFNLFDGRPEVIDTVADVLKQTVYSLPRKKDAEVVVKSLILLFHHDLPEVLRLAIESDKAFMRYLGVEESPVVEFSGLSFDAQAFWEAARRAVNGESTSIETLDGDDSVVLHLISGYRIGFYHRVENAIIELGDFSPMLSEPSVREQVLRAQREWFDCPPEAAEKAIRDILEIGNDGERLEKSHSWRDSSPALYYSTLKRKIEAQAATSFSDLSPPNIERLAWHLRLPQNVEGSFENVVEAAAAQAR